jgi:hypothetical protein
MKGYVDSVASQSIYGNANVLSYLTGGFDGNIIPSANVTYSLGSPTNQWKDLFVSNSTIYIGGVPLSIDAGGNLLINGNTVSGGGSSYSNVQVKAFLETDAGPADNFERKIEGYYANLILGDDTKLYSYGSSSTSYFGHDGFANININYVRAGQGDIQIGTNNGTHTWTFDNTGNLTLPGATAGETIATSGGYITVGNLLIGQGGSLFNSNNDSWALFGNRSEPGTSITIPSNDSAGNGQPITIENQISNVEIVSGNNTWTFDVNANLTLPAGGQILDSTGNLYASGSSYSNVQVATYLPTYTGNISADNVSINNSITASAVEAEYFSVGTAIFNKSNTATDGVTITTTGGAKNTIELIPNGGNSTIKLTAELTTVSGNIISRDITAGNISATGTSGKLGYNQGTFAQQITSNSTQVTSNFTSGNIQLMSIDLGVNAVHTVTFGCNKITANDMVLIKHVSGGITSVYVDAYIASDGLAVIWLRNISGIDTGPFTPMLKYAIIRAPSS